MTAAPAAAGDQFTVASLSLGGALECRIAWRRRRSMVRNVLNTPDILGVQDVEDFAALTAVGAGDRC